MMVNDNPVKLQLRCPECLHDLQEVTEYRRTEVKYRIYVVDNEIKSTFYSHLRGGEHLRFECPVCGITQERIENFMTRVQSEKVNDKVESKQVTLF